MIDVVVGVGVGSGDGVNIFDDILKLYINNDGWWWRWT